MAELCTTCTQFIDRISNIPNASHYGSENFATFSQIEAAAFTCTFCKVFSNSIQCMPTSINFNVTLQIHWFVSKPGLAFMMLDNPAPEDKSENFNAIHLVSAESTPSDMPLRQRYIISYHKSKKSPQLSSIREYTCCLSLGAMIFQNIYSSLCAISRLVNGEFA